MAALGADDLKAGPFKDASDFFSLEPGKACHSEIC